MGNVTGLDGWYLWGCFRRLSRWVVICLLWRRTAAALVASFSEDFCFLLLRISSSLSLSLSLSRSLARELWPSLCVCLPLSCARSLSSPLILSHTYSLAHAPLTCRHAGGDLSCCCLFWLRSLILGSGVVSTFWLTLFFQTSSSAQPPGTPPCRHCGPPEYRALRAR